jgi:hypothetical protein
MRGCGSAATAAIASLYIGEGAGSGSVAFAGTPTQLLVSGSASFTIPGSSAIVRTDTTTFTLDETKEYVVSFYMNNTSSLQALTATSVNSFYKNANDAATIAATGYTGGYANRSLSVFRLEVS